jgi:transcriptional regulator with XRE-family HTH domain
MLIETALSAPPPFKSPSEANVQPVPQQGRSPALVPAQAPKKATAFSTKARKLWEASGIPQNELADRVGVTPQRLNNWMSGYSGPTNNDAVFVRALENVFHAASLCAPGELTSLVRVRSRRGRASSDRYVSIDDSQRKRIRTTRNFTSAEMNASPKKFKKLYDEAAASDIERVDPIVVATVNTRRDKVEPFCGPLTEELEQFKSLSTLKVPDLSMPGKPLTQRADGGAGIETRRHARVMGFLRDDEKGPRIPNGLLSLCLFLFPDNVRKTLVAKQAKMLALTGKMYLVEEDIALFQAGKNLLAPPNGYVFQNPDMFLPRLQPIEGVVTASRIEEISRDWKGACKEAFVEYGDLQKTFGQFIAPSVVRRRAVEDMMNHPDPLFVFDLLNQRMSDDLATIDPDCLRWRVHLSDCILARIETDCGFRSGTLRKLDIDELQETSKGWTLSTSRFKFKNPEGPYFKLGANKYRDFERVLSDVNGSFDMIELYKSKVWPTLPHADRSRALFKNLSERRNDAEQAHYPRVLSRTFSDRFRAFTGMYLCNSENGIEGLYEFTTHQARALLCAGTLKRLMPKYGLTDAMKLAADKICDSIGVAESIYARWDGAEREAMLRDGSVPAATAR